MPESKFEPGDLAVVNQGGFYDGQEVEVEEVLKAPSGFSYIVDIPAGYYNRVVEQSGGVFGYPWHGESTKATFSEEELVHPKHEDALTLKNGAVEIAEHPSLFGGGG